MAHDVFISYSSKDKLVADAVCATLESQKVRCWIAPRDVAPGIPYAAALVSAISAARVFVLVLSQGSNASGQVLREVEEAVSTGIPIITLRIEDFEPTEAMRYYIKSLHWLDAMSPPLEQHLLRLATSVQALMSIEAEEQAPPVSGAAIDTPAKKRWPLPTWATILLALAAVVLVGGLASWAASRLRLGTTAGRIDPTLVALPAEITAPTEVAPTPGAGSSTDEVPAENGSDWRRVSFLVTDPQLWEETGDNRYTAVGQAESDAFAWSQETFDGDLAIRVRLESPATQSEGCIILYGDGQGHSYGSLIFCVESGFYQLEKHTRYHQGEHWVAAAPSNIEFGDSAYSVSIEIVGDTASMYVDGEKVLSTFFDAKEIDRKGRIGLHKIWMGSEITFSDIQVKDPADGGSGALFLADDGWECDVDNSYYGFHPVESTFSFRTIEVDGKTSSPEEWAEASCVDLRMHYSLNVSNPNHQRIRWWVQNNEQDVSFLVRIPKGLATDGVFVNYFWPEYTGSWAHSDGVYVNVDGEIFDHGMWDELQWYSDTELDPPGTIDVQAAHSQDDQYDWFEISRPLKSSDSRDWALEPGQTVGNNPLDSFMVGTELAEGAYMRYLQLVLGRP